MKTLLSVAMALFFAAGAKASDAPAEFDPLLATNGTLVAGVKYGSHPRQVLDAWLPKGAVAKVPAVIFVHGGGWTKGDRRKDIPKPLSAACLRERCALVTVDYRFLNDARAAGINPPVRAPMDDVTEAIRYTLKHADEWKIDVRRIGLTGGSAGACSSLAIAFGENNRFGIRAVAAAWPQTSLDPQEMRKWIPNIQYGSVAFGYKTFDLWLTNRVESLPWIDRYSPAGLVRKCAADRLPVVITDTPRLCKPGELPKDPTHAGEFRARFGEVLRSRGGDYRETSFARLHSTMIAILKK